MLVFSAVALVSYLLGSIPAGYLAGRIAGIDIRHAGSGNIGATNVTRVLGKRYGYPVFIVDFLKGLMAVSLSILIEKRAQPISAPTELFGIVAAISSVIGHAFPVWCEAPNRGSSGSEDRQDSNLGCRELGNRLGVVVGKTWATNLSLGEQPGSGRARAKNAGEQRVYSGAAIT